MRVNVIFFMLHAEGGLMRGAVALLAFIFVFVPNAFAFAAIVNATQGQVLLNNGKGFQRLNGSTDANPGATVMVNPGGSAQVVYPDGCTVPIEPGTVYTIEPQSTCNKGIGGISPTTFAIGAVVVGGGVATAVLLSQKKNSNSNSTSVAGSTTTPTGPGGIVVPASP